MKKRIISIVLVVAVVLSSLAFSYSALAITIGKIALNTYYTDAINGIDDKVWYTYTPSVSGKYAFVSYSTGNEAYLFTKKDKMYTQLAYAPNNDPDYLNHFRYFVDANGNQDTSKRHYEKSFYMECYLIKGTTYYFAAGYENEEKASGNVNVALYNLEYDESEQQIKSISANCSSKLSAYTDGAWETDSNGDNYFRYNYSKIIQNMKINIEFKDGTKTQIDGIEEVYDGMKISYAHNQSVNHWYAQNSDEYTNNTLTVKVGPYSCDFDVQIETSAMYGAKGKIVDYVTNEPIDNAEIYLGNTMLATTTSKGYFAFTQPAGTYSVTVKTNSSIDYTYQFVINSSDISKNDQTSKPIKLINCDYIKDGIINAKDYAFAKKNGYAFNSSVTNFTKANY